MSCLDLGLKRCSYDLEANAADAGFKHDPTLYGTATS